MFLNQRTTLPLLVQEDYLELLIEGFLTSREAENVTAGTMSFYRQKLTNFVNFCSTQQIKTVSQISPSTIREFLIHLRSRRHNDGGVHAHYRVVRTFLKWYEREYEPDGWHNPIYKTKPPRVAVEPLDPARVEDVEKMIKACGNDKIGKRNKAMMHFLLDTGTRASEMLGVKLKDIDLITGEILIRSGKGRKPRFVFLGERARRSLRQYLKLRHDNGSHLWATSDGGGLSYWGLVSELKRLAEKAGVRPPSIHSFRRFWALKMLSDGKTDLLSISRLGGWASLQMLQRYAKQSKSDLKAKASSPLDNL